MIKERFPNSVDIRFQEGMDPNSRDIVIDGEVVGYFRLTDYKTVTFRTFDQADICVPLDIIKAIIAEKERIKGESHLQARSTQAYGKINFWRNTESTLVFVDNHMVGNIRRANEFNAHPNISFNCTEPKQHQTLPLIHLDMWVLYVMVAEYERMVKKG
jgi:hypothetical protein